MARRSDHSREELYEMALDAARQVAERDGLRGITSRGIARDIGYTIGTIYNLFDDLDDIIVHLNTRTLEELYEALSAIKPRKDPEKYLLALAQAYMEYTQQYPKLWGLLLEHRLPEGRTLPDSYYERLYRLYGLIEKAIGPHLSARQGEKSRHMARVLWSSVHGICSLGAQEKLAAEESQAEMVRTLVKTFINGVRADVRQ
jgi:AcrR family transcriptional regulator